MKLRGILALMLALAGSSALAQVQPGTSPLSGPKGGTNNAFMQFSGPATSLKTYTLPNVTGTLAMLSQIQTWTGAQTFSGGINSASIAPITDSTTGLRINNQAQTHNIVTIDSTNFRVGINKTPGAFDLDVAGLTNFSGAVTFAAGGSLVGTFSGTPTFSGANFLTLANLPQSTAGAQFLGVSGASLGNYAPFTLASLSNLASPNATLDLLPIVDHNTGTIKNVSPSALGAAGAVSTVNVQGGALVLWPYPEGRLTLTSGTPVMATSVSAATTVYYTGYAGKNVPIYNGTAVAVYQICAANTAGACEQSVVLGSNWVTNLNYDFFEGLNGGVPTLCTGPAWTSGAVGGSDTARGTGAGSTELQQFDGLNTNKNSMTCRYNNTSGAFTCAANQCTYLGTMRTGSTGQTNFIYGASAAGGTPGLFGLWNAYNRISVKTTVTDSTASWTYSSATIRSMDNSAGNRVSFVMGLAEDGISTKLQARVAEPVTGIFKIGMALDATNALDKQALIAAPAAAAYNAPLSVGNDYNPQLGFHFIQATEQGDGSITGTLNGGVDQSFIAELSM